jgi:hypothetical protein
MLGSSVFFRRDARDYSGGTWEQQTRLAPNSSNIYAASFSSPSPSLYVISLLRVLFYSKGISNSKTWFNTRGLSCLVRKATFYYVPVI